ncbi:hypothetical protein [Pseudonocardia endophytica]|uniref:Uncharacterized protein n=1 Tax=Pseudonocardia endophytica TaxID=401976 RepID=A0A4R1HG53_PSEEN|nr:hypothetical protein [Pseudonocardia endophytica]TCK19831.1 hypothetical protein EV378_3774 [Pseudonocardia endophytica]
MPDGLHDPGPGLRWESVADIRASTWVEVPIDEGPLRWLRVVAVKPPSWTGERRWALSVADGPEEWWIKVAPGLVFRTCDRETPPG